MADKPSSIEYLGTAPQQGQTKSEYAVNGDYLSNFVSSTLVPNINLTNDYIEAGIAASEAAQGVANYKGDWTIVTNVLQGESYSYDGSVWIAKVDSVGQTPIAGVYWFKGVGTVASLNTGTGAGEVPTNSDLGDSATLDTATAEEISAGVTGKVVTDDELSESRYALSEKSVSITMTDATYTLSDTENLYGRIVISGTLTAEQDLIVSDDERFLTIKNDTNYAIKVKTSSGTGVHVEVGEQFSLRVQGGNVASNGRENKIVILPVDSWTSATYTYPFSHDQAYYDSILVRAGRSTIANVTRGLGSISGDLISENETDWILRVVMSSAASDIETTITHSSNTQFITSSVGSGDIKSMMGFLKDGVTY